MKKAALILLTLASVACSTNPPHPVAQLPGWPVAPVAAEVEPVRVLQQLDARFLGRNEQFQSVIVIEPGTMQVILLGASGQRLATITQEGSKVHAETAVKLPVELPLMQIVETIQLVYFPLDELTAHLQQERSSDSDNGKRGSGKKDNGEWQVEQHGLNRQVFFQGKLYAQIVYTGADPWSGKTDYKNLAHNYSFTINSGRLP